MSLAGIGYVGCVNNYLGGHIDINIDIRQAVCLDGRQLQRNVTMHHIDHIRAYWLHRAMSIPGGAALEERRVEYWSCIAHLNSCRILCGALHT